MGRVALREPMHLCTCVSEEGGEGEAPCPETPSPLSYTLRYVSFAEVGSVCRVALREPMHLCTCVSEEGGDGEASWPETPPLAFAFFFSAENQLELPIVLEPVLIRPYTWFQEELGSSAVLSACSFAGGRASTGLLQDKPLNPRAQDKPLNPRLSKKCRFLVA